MNLLLNMKDINKILAKTRFKCKYKKKCEKKPYFCENMSLWHYLEVSLSCLHFSLMVSEGEVKSPCFLQVWWALTGICQFIQVKLTKIPYIQTLFKVVVYSWFNLDRFHCTVKKHFVGNYWSKLGEIYHWYTGTILQWNDSKMKIAWRVNAYYDVQESLLFLFEAAYLAGKQ